MEPAIAQLRGVFPFASYRLLDAAIVRAGGRRTVLDARLPLLGPGARYKFVVVVDDIAADHVRLGALSLNLRDNEGHELAIETSTTIRDGQSVIVGKSNSAKAGEAYFLVVGVKLVE